MVGQASGACSLLQLHSSSFPARGHQLRLTEAGVPGHRGGDAAACLRGLQRVHLRLWADGGWQVLHHDGQTGEGPAGHHPTGKQGGQGRQGLERALLKGKVAGEWGERERKVAWAGGPGMGCRGAQPLDSAYQVHIHEAGHWKSCWLGSHSQGHCEGWEDGQGKALRTE